MTPEQENRLRILAQSSIVGGDIKAAMKEIDRLRIIEAKYNKQINSDGEGKQSRRRDSKRER